MDGVARCTRYAFGPNRLHYCGPDASHEIGSYIEEGGSDPGLEALLRAFRTMYPYLQHIADANGIRNPFDERVVEAYWIGNELLDTVDKKKFYRHLREGLNLRDHLGGKNFDRLTDKLRRGAVPHHSFHVFDVWKRTGHAAVEHTLESLDSCRISWGVVRSLEGPQIVVDYEPLSYLGGKLQLGSAVHKRIRRSLEGDLDIDLVKPGDIITMHWDTPCEVITAPQARRLKHYTLRHLALANETI